MYQKKINETDVKKVDYMVLKQLELHAKKYDSAPNKKEFLKNVCAYEQKIILLNSKNPYEVLNYMQELDLKSSKLVLEELSYEEIKRLLELFTSEHKKMFYNSFSSLELVNSFITCDKKSYEYVKDLSFDRKINLLKNSKKETIQATTELYDSMSNIEKKEAEQTISFESSAEASFSLNEMMDSSESYQAVNMDEITEENTENEEDLLEIDLDKVEEQDENINTEKEQELENAELLKEKNDFLKANIQNYIEKNGKFEEIDMNSEDVYALLSAELKSIVDNDFNLRGEGKKEDIQQPDESINSEQSDLYLEETKNQKDTEDIKYLEKYSIIGNGESYASVVSNPMTVYEFEQLKNTSEKMEIENLKSKLEKSLEIDEQKQM